MKVHGEAVDLQRLDDLIERADSRNYTQGIDAAKIFTMLRSEKVAQHTTPWVWPLTVIVVSIGCGALWPIWFTLVKVCCPWLERCITCTLRPTTTYPTNRLNENEIDLQILPQRDGILREDTTSRASSRDDPEMQSALTGFVGHGRLAVGPLWWYRQATTLEAVYKLQSESTGIDNWWLS